MHSPTVAAGVRQRRQASATPTAVRPSLADAPEAEISSPKPCVKLRIVAQAWRSAGQLGGCGHEVVSAAALHGANRRGNVKWSERGAERASRNRRVSSACISSAVGPVGCGSNASAVSRSRTSRPVAQARAAFPAASRACGQRHDRMDVGRVLGASARV